MAQKFTIDPRMLQATRTGAARSASIDEDTESESDEELTAEEKKSRERAALKERLSREYEESLAEAKAAAAAGEGCTMCSA